MYYCKYVILFSKVQVWSSRLYSTLKLLISPDDLFKVCILTQPQLDLDNHIHSSAHPSNTPVLTLNLPHTVSEICIHLTA